MNAPRAGGPRRTPRPDRPEDDEIDPALKAAARPRGRPSSLPAPGLTVEPRYGGDVATATVARAEPEARPTDPPMTTPQTRSRPDVEESTEHHPTRRERRREREAELANRSGRRRGRRVKRTIRRIDLWSVLKLSLVVYACIYAAVLGTIAALWGLAYSSGSVEKLESFLADVGLENYHFYGDRMFKACAAIGAVGVLAATVLTVLATALVNVISEITGGIRITVIEEDV